jgi:hypothetical protein
MTIRLQVFKDHIVDWENRVVYFGEDARVLALVLKHSKKGK